MKNLIPLVITCIVAAGLASCEVTGEESFGFKEGNSLTVIGPGTVAIDSTAEFYLRAFTIKKDYQWSMAAASNNAADPAGWDSVARDGEYLHFTPRALGFYTISIEDQTEGYKGSATVDVTDFIPGELAHEGYTELESTITAAGLTDTLSSKYATYTIFAPTNEAMAAAGAITADEIWHHVVLNGPSSADLADSTQFETKQGSVLTAWVDECEEGEENCEDTIYIGTEDDGTVITAKVVATDSSATNGVVHGIDTVLEL